jgi:hypothetical protein
MEQFHQMSSQGRVPIHNQKKCDKSCLIDKIIDTARTKSGFIYIVDGLTHTLPYNKEKEPTENDMVALRRYLHRENIPKLLDLLKLTPDEAIETLLNGNNFSPTVVKIVIQKRYEPNDLASIILQMRDQSMNTQAITHAFAHLTPDEMFTLMHHKPDLVHVLNCKYNNGCVTLHDIKDKLS